MGAFQQFMEVLFLFLLYSQEVQGNGDVGFPLPSFHQQDVFQRVLMDVGNESSMTCPSEDERLQIITASYIGFAPNCSHVHEFTKHRASPNCAGIELESIIKDICNERSHCSVPQEIIAKLCNETNLDLNVIYQCIGFASTDQEQVKMSNLRKDTELACADYNKRIAIVSILNRSRFSNCRAIFTESFIKGLCDGRTSCAMDGSMSTLAMIRRDPCFRANKLLEVIYTCLAAD